MTDSKDADEVTPADAVLAEYLERTDRGEKLDRAKFITEHPEAAADLRSYFHSLDTVNRALGDTRQPPARGTATTRGDLPRDFGSYVLLELLGAGGMGEVYKAEHKHMERVVAVKTLHAEALDSAEAVERFHREVKAAAKFSHRNVVTAFDAGEVDGVHFLAMEYVDGGNLHWVVVRCGPLPVEQAVDYVIQAARGLEYAHRNQVIHRDVKPANLLLDREGTIKLLDLGLARVETPASRMASTGSESLTRSGQIMGTIDYMAPEQALDTKHAGVSADVYSLGCTLFFLLTGRIPYPADTPMEGIVAHRERPIPSLRDLCSDVPESLDAVFRQMVAKRADARQASMREVIEQLEGCLPARARASGPWPFPSPEVDGPDVGRGSPEARSERDPSHVATVSQTDDSSLSAGPQLDATSDWTTRVPPQRGPNRSRAILVGPLVAAALAAIALGVVFRIRTPNGTIVLEIDQPDAHVTILDEEGQLEIECSGGDGSLRISVDPGKYRLLVEKEGFSDHAEGFTIRSRATKEFTIRLEQPEGDPASSEPPPAIASLTPEEVRENQQRWADRHGVAVELENSIGMKLVLIPPGEFLMGSTEEEIKHWQPRHNDAWAPELVPAEGPKHRVRITRPFYLAVHEVTVGQFRAFIDDTGYQTAAETGAQGSTWVGTDYEGTWKRQEGITWQSPGWEQTGDQPVVQLCWRDATAFCRWLSDKEGAEYSLPTEAQWEYACRSGSTTTWSFGDDEAELKQYAWYGLKGGAGTKPVGTKRPNAFGLFDMHGNVREWCYDRYGREYYAESPQDDPVGLPSGPLYVHRGGSWDLDPVFCRSAARCRNFAHRIDGRLGFRVARVAVGEWPPADN
jgi:formylglycine-generating enzyme required for sulfatase activity/serine/threonine protein kinase